MSSHSQSGSKKQKVREGKTGDNVEYFHGIDKLEYNNMASSSDSGSYRYFNGAERMHGRAMEDWLKCSVSLTEFRSYDNYLRSSHKRPWDDGTNTIDNHKRCIKALLEFCYKLGVKYWTAFDTDLVPATDNWDEYKSHWDEIVEYIQELSLKYHVKLLWLAPDLHSHPRYMSGAFTSHDISTFAHAALLIKKCLEISQRLNAECFLIWPYREGYDAIFLNDVARELKLFAKLLKVTAEFKEKLNYKCQLIIMPYNGNIGRNCFASFGLWQHSQWREIDLINTYMWDATSCLYLLKNYNLDHFYKVCTPPGHHMYMAYVYNMLGGIYMTTDVNHSDTKTMTLTMKCILDQGAVPAGGISLRFPPRRDGDLRELFSLYAKYIDALAKGLRLAMSIEADQLFSKYVQQRYVSYNCGFGSRVLTGDVSMEDCEEYCKKNEAHSDVPSAKTEHFEIVFQRYLDTCERV